jgi:predicted deacylase
MSFFGDEREAAIVVVGSIQGDQTNTRDLVIALVRHFDDTPQDIPAGVTLYFVPTLNPDGNVSNSRFNANDVDLNRNWGSSDWKSNAAVPGYPDGKPGAGGDYAFSEPETSALRDFLLRLQPRGENVRVVVLHSSVRRTRGEIYPGGSDAVSLANRYAAVADYDVEGQWAEYVTSGELVTWCDEQGITSIDVVFPGSQTPLSTVPGTGDTLLSLTVRALLEVARFP